MVIDRACMMTSDCCAVAAVFLIFSSLLSVT